MEIKRNVFNELSERLKAKTKRIQVLLGPRQVGKTTGIRQVCREYDGEFHYVSADAPHLKSVSWIAEQWEIARFKAQKSGQFLLVIDEIQKIAQWSEVVKSLYDADQFAGHPFQVVLLGSAQSILAGGVHESLAGRCEILPVTHWSFSEIHELHGCTLDEYIFYGGYPGSYEYAGDLERWRSYLLDSIIEATLSKDVLLVERIQKPALLRRLFELGCQYSGKILSYQKLLGQLQDAGNTTTLAHYLQLLNSVALLTGLEKYAGDQARRRASSPKFCVYNTAYLTAFHSASLEYLRQAPAEWGHWVESAVGAHLLNQSIQHRFNVYYWREGADEVDFILVKHNKVVAIEVKSSQYAGPHRGLDKLQKHFQIDKMLVVGGDGLSVEEFLLKGLDSVWAT